MTTEERTELKQKIEQAISVAKREKEYLEDASKPVAPENSIGRVSRMDAINNKSVSEASLRSVKRRLSNLELALHKIDDESFGKCSRCGRVIAPKRLMFMPQSTRCISCADRV